MSIFGGIGSVVGADIIAYVKLSGAETFNKDLDKLNANAASFGKAMNATMNAAVIGAGVAFVGAAAAAVQFESSFAGVLKTTDGLTDSMGNINDEGRALSEEFRKLALEVPLSVNELNRIGELGGQLGIAKESLITFTSVIAQLGTTTDLSYEQGATAIAQFINVTKSVVPVGVSVDEQLERIASTLVDLGNNSVATESQIIEFAQRLAGAGATIGLSQDEILAFSAALSSVGVNAEAGGTAFSKLFIDLKSAVELGGEDLQKFADAANMSIGEFKTLFEQDASAAIVKFIEGLNETSRSGDSVIQVLDDLGITETRMRNAILLSVNAGNLLNDTLVLGKTAYSENAAMAEEFAQRTATTEAQLTLLKNAVMDILIELGQNFLPIIRTVAETLAEHPTILSNILILLMGTGGIIAAVKLWTAAQAAFDVLGATKLFSGLAAAIQANALQFTAVMGVIGAAVIAYQQISAAIAQAESAVKQLQEATDLNTKVNDIAITGMKSMVDALVELRTHGGSELVAFGDNVMTVSKAIEIITGLITKSKEEGKIYATTLNLSFDSVAVSSEKLKIATEQLHTSFIGYVGSMHDAELSNERIQPLIESTSTDIGVQKTATDSANSSWAEYSQLIHEITGKMGPVGDAINLVVDSIVSGGNPLVTALNLASMAWGLFSGEEEKVVLSTDEVMDSVFGANSEFIKMYENISNITSAFGDYDIVRLYSDNVDSLAQQLTDLINSGNASAGAIGQLKNALTESLAELDKFRQAAEYLNPTLATQANKLSGELADAWEYYGHSIPDDVFQAAFQMAGELELKLMNLISTLAVGSPAWEDATTALLRLRYEMDVLAGRSSSVAEYLRNINEMNGELVYSAQQVSSFLQAMGYSADDAAQMMLELGYSLDEIAAKFKTPITFQVNGNVNIPPLTDAQLRTLYASYVLHMKDIGQGYYNYSYWLGKYNGGELLLHNGGMIRAHSGAMLDNYGSMKEVPFLGLEGEYVMNPNIGRKFGEAALDAFNVSGNPAVLGGSESSVPNIEVIVEPTIEITGELSEMAWARITDTKINKRIKETNAYKTTQSIF